MAIVKGRPAGDVRVILSPRWRFPRSPLLVPMSVGVVAFVLALLALSWASNDRPVLRLEVAFDAQACCSWQVWVGGAVDGDMTLLPVNAGTTQVYEAPIWTPHVERLFVTVGSQPGGTASVRRIWVTRGDRTVDEVPAAQLRQATVYGATGQPIAAGLALSSTAAQPAFDLSVSLDAHEGRVQLLLAHLVEQRRLTLAGLIVFGAAALAFLGAGRRRWALAAAIAVTVVGVRGLPWVSWNMIDFHDDVTRAVGYSAYVGLWKARERFILELAALIPVLVAVAVALLARRGGSLPEPRDDEHQNALPRALAAGIVALPVVAVALSAVPNLRLYLGQAPEHVPSWDANNFLFWQYLVQTTDLEPVRDFFWLYGLQWVFNEPAPWGLLAPFLWFLTFWLFVAVGSWWTLGRFFSGRSLVARYVLLSAFWLTAALTSDLAFATRYVAPLGALLLFTGLGRAVSWWSWKRGFFALALASVALFEPAQAMYALAAIVFFAAAELLTEVVRDRGARQVWLLTTTGTLVLPIAIALAVFVTTGTASETLSLYRGLTLSSSAYAFPSQVDEWVTTPMTLESMIFWAVPLTLAIGVAGLLLSRTRARLSYGVVAALGVLGLMIMQKQILRPHAAIQVWLPLIFGLVFWAVSDTFLAATRRWSVVLATAGVAAALVLVSGGYRQAWHSVSAGPERTRGTIDALLHERATFERQEDDTFAPRTFARFTDGQAVVRALRELPAAERSPLWILGDEAQIPMMLGQSWPYYFNNLYDASPIDFQQKVLDELAQHPPDVVVWNSAPHAMIFDAVPNPVRVPLLFTWAVRNLVRHDTVGTFEILRPRRDHEPVDLPWWRDRIGARIDLGRIPAVSHLPDALCERGTRCVAYLVVTFPKGVPHLPQVVVPVVVDGLDFEIAFTGGEESRYVVALDRVWFTAANPAAPRRIETAPIGGATVEIEHRLRDPDKLY